MATSFADPRIVPSRRDYGIEAHLYNFTENKFWKFKKQLHVTRNAANAGTGIGSNDTKILTFGDSNTAGIGGSLAATQLPLTSWPNFMAKRMSATSFAGVGKPTTLAGTIAVTGGVGGSWIDNRFSMGGWGTVAGVANAGWSPGATTGFMAANTNGQTLVFTPGFAWDRANIYYMSSTATGAFSITATGGSTTNIAAGVAAPAATQLLVATVSAASLSAANTVTLVRTATEARYAYVTMIEVWNSAQAQIRVTNTAVSGSSAQGWNMVGGTLPTASPKKHIENYAPHLTVVDLGGNDSTVPRSNAQYLADMQALQTSAQLSGDFVVKSMLPLGGANAARDAIHRGYIDTLIGAGIPVIDVHRRIGPFTPYDNAGYMSADDIHGNDFSFGEAGAWVASVLAGV